MGIKTNMPKTIPPTPTGISPAQRDHSPVAADAKWEEAMRVADRFEVAITHQAAEVSEKSEDEACLSRPGGQMSKIRFLHKREYEEAVEKMYEQEDRLVEEVVA